MTRLTSVANVKNYLAAFTTGSSDVIIDTLISQWSSAIEQLCNRRFTYSTLTKRLDGTGTDRQVLPLTPIVKVSQVTVNGSNIPASPDACQSGYVFDETSLSLIGSGKFWPGRQNVSVSWESGWRATGNATVPPTTANVPSAVTVGVLDMEFDTDTDGPSDVGFPMKDRGVATITGVAFTSVPPTANGPLTQQYSFVDGIYTFNSTDTGTPLQMTFDYAPSPVENACIEAIAYNIKKKGSLGITSQTLAGNTTTYDKNAMGAGALAMLQQYTSVTPV